MKQVLNKVTREVSNVDDSSATDDVNVPKNRYQDKIPCKEKVQKVLSTYSYTQLFPDNHSRVRLKPTAVQGSDYINASFVDVIEFFVVSLLYQA